MRRARSARPETEVRRGGVAGAGALGLVGREQVVEEQAVVERGLGAASAARVGRREDGRDVVGQHRVGRRVWRVCRAQRVRHEAFEDFGRVLFLLRVVVVMVRHCGGASAVGWLAGWLVGGGSDGASERIQGK